MNLRKYVLKSRVEEIAQLKYGQFCSTDIENINKVVVPDYETLGKLTALRFIEWCQLNPGGVVSLATGNTPKSFIKTMQHILENWNAVDVQKELGQAGVAQDCKPDLSTFTLIQMDEYFPINPSDEKSFNYYIKTNYLSKFGFDITNCLLMDLSDFSFSQAEQFACDFEAKIKDLGGIGFFLGGIGPEGHIAFNFPGSEQDSKTRVLPINYESAAAVAANFGGIEFIKDKKVLTIGLQTITQNPTTTAIVIADGVGKANVVQQALESKSSNSIPATALQKLSGARFYLTSTAASNLKTYKYLVFNKEPQNVEHWGQQVLIDLALEKQKAIFKLDYNEVEHDFLGKLLLQQNIDLDTFINKTCNDLKNKIGSGLGDFTGKKFLHTSPHPDDVLLGCFPFINQHFKDPWAEHYFATMTSGSNTVQDDYFLQLLNNLEEYIDSILPIPEDQDRDVQDYVRALDSRDQELENKAMASRTLRNFAKFMNLNLFEAGVSLFHLSSAIKNKIEEVKDLISKNIKNDFIINIKSSVREFEEDLVWGHLGFGHSNVKHLNLGFYASKDKSIHFERDVKPVLNLLNQLNPNIITVALDPSVGGHPTHYKVRQIIVQALKHYDKKDIQIWGYSNVWFRFKPTQTNLYLTASNQDFVLLNKVFNNCYKSQVKAAVPSPEHDGPFSELMQKIMTDQYNSIHLCLGDDFFDNSQDKRIINAKGLFFIKTMLLEEFLNLND